MIIEKISGKKITSTNKAISMTSTYKRNGQEIENKAGLRLKKTNNTKCVIMVNYILSQT